MSEIHILESNISNQIAAGEVIDRPASVVKELLENAVDAGATEITLVIVDAGQTLIQVIDNGKGMSEEDAKLSFVRHATSKIRNTEDLWSLYTFGFRGEALASVGSVSNVEMRTRLSTESLGVHLFINGGTMSDTVSIQCPVGTSISVKNIFYNIPARRKFLKSDSYEKQVIINEFEKIILANPQIKFTLQIDQDPTPRIYPICSLRERISSVLTSSVDKSLIPVALEAPEVTIKGWISSPMQKGRSSNKVSRFFVNGRFMRNHILQKAITSAYGKLISTGEHPYFFIFIDINPSQIDINIHPTKTEIKFENETLVWQLLNSSIKQAIGSASLSPAIEFTNSYNVNDIPIYNSNNHSSSNPETTNNNNYNPFSSTTKSSSYNSTRDSFNSESTPFNETLLPPRNVKSVFDSGAKLFFEQQSSTSSQYETEQIESERYEYVTSQATQPPLDIETSYSLHFFQLNKRHIITSLSNKLTIIDYPRALERIIYERVLASLHNDFTPSQMELIPEQIELSLQDATLIIDSVEELSKIGFEISNMGQGIVSIQAIPAYLSGKVSAKDLIYQLLDGLLDTKGISFNKEKLAMAISLGTSNDKLELLTNEQIQDIINNLLSCSEPSLTPKGLPIMISIEQEELYKKLKLR